MANRMRYSDSTGRVVVMRGEGENIFRWSLSVDRSWLGWFGGGLPSVANYAAAYTRLTLRPLDEADILRELSEDLALKGIEEAQK